LDITQANTNLFKMPLEVVLSGPDFEQKYTIIDSAETQRFVFVTENKPDNLEIDPDNWIMNDLSLSFVEGDLREPPSVFTVSQNYPNPFNPETSIDIILPEDGLVNFEVFNTLGQKVYEDISEQTAGYRTLVWKGETNLGTSASSGIYLYRVKYGSEVVTKKMILVR
jgi:hypothetical protein